MSHYIKIMLDYIFGRENFRNEVVWCYTGPSNVKSNYPRKHDIVFYYVKTSNAVLNLDDVRVPYNAKSFTMGGKKSLARKNAAEGTDHNTGKEAYLERGKAVEDWWVDIPSLSVSKERLGYPTQKPEALLERIIKASSNLGDTVAD